MAEEDEVAFEGAIYAMAADRAGNESDYTAFGTGRNDDVPDLSLIHIWLISNWA